MSTIPPKSQAGDMRLAPRRIQPLFPINPNIYQKKDRLVKIFKEDYSK